MIKMSDITYMIIAAAVILYGILSFLVGTKMNSFRNVKTIMPEVTVSQKSIPKPEYLYEQHIQSDLTKTPKEKIYL